MPSGDRASAGLTSAELDMTLRPGDRQDTGPGDETQQLPPPHREASSGVARGTLVGRFVVLDRAGTGGMGVVYVAYDPELDRRVALKLMHPAPGGDSSSGRVRLLREAQSMAQLAHPNVAAIFDVGTHGDVVYIAMEFIEGQTLTDWLGATTRTWREIVARFVEAGRGIEAAHAVGIVHRDLKPDNIMIGRDGRVRVLDFGLARALSGPRSSDDGYEPTVRSHASSLDIQLTAPGLVIGTPMYMAPEQHLGRGVDERSDQYSFCVAIWEALHGGRPFGGRSLPEIAANVIEGRVIEPSGIKLPAWLREALRRGMAVDPAARFPSMSALLQELARERGRALRFAALGLVGAAGLGTAIAATYMLSAESVACDGGDSLVGDAWDDSRRAAVDAAFTAEQKAYAAESWAHVAERLDAYASGIATMADEACTAARIRGTQSDEVMGRRMACLERRARRLGALTQTLALGGSTTIQNAVDAVHGLPDLALCGDVDELMRAVPPPDDPQTRAAVEEVRGEIEEVRGIAMAGYSPGLDSSYEELVARARATGYEPVVAEALLQMGLFQGNFGDGDHGIAALEEALDAAERSGHDTIIAEASLALVLGEGRRRGRFEVADMYARRAAAVIERMGGSKPLRQLMYSNIAQIENVRGRGDEARAAAEQALAVSDEMGQQQDPRRLPILNALAVALIADDRLEDADAALQQALALAESQVGLAHPNAGVVFANLARLRAAQERPNEALALFSRASEVFTNAVGPDHPNLAAIMNGEGLVLVNLGRDEEAVAAFREAARRLEKIYGRDGFAIAPALSNLGGALTRLGRGAEAVENVERARAIKQARLGDDAPEVGFADDLVGDAWGAAGDLEKAKAAYRRSIALFERIGGADDPRAAYGHAGLGRIAVRESDRATARAELERALVLQKADAGGEARGDLRFDLAKLIVDEDPARARALAEAAQAEYREVAVTRQRESLELARWLDAHR